MNAAPTPKPQTSDVIKTAPAISHTKFRVAVFLPAIVLALSLVALRFARHFGALSGSADAVALLVATSVALLVLSRRLPLQNIFGLAVVMTLFSGGCLFISSAAQISCGSPIWNKNFHSLQNWSAPLLWLFALVTARGAAQFLLRPWRGLSRYGFGLIALTCLLIGGLDCLANRSLERLFAKLLLSFFAYLLTLPWFLDKRPIESPADSQPLLLILLVFLW